MWESLEENIKEKLPECVKKILTVCGFDNAISFCNLKDSDMNDIEIYVNKHLRSTVDSLTCCKSEIYQAQNEFRFLPGHKKIILHFVQQMRLKQEEEKLPTTNKLLSEGINFIEQVQNQPAFPYLLREFITNSIHNYKKHPNGKRYTDTIQAFSTYIYMLCGRNCYEIISKNLPMPQASSILNYIHEKKVRVTEGDLRCKDLRDYLNAINAPKCVWLSEDGSGIVAKTVYDSSSNQLVGLNLPIDVTTGMPVLNSFKARSVKEIEKHMLHEKSTLVYTIVAQPISDKGPFILQLYGTNNKFNTTNVLKRWEYTIAELKKYGITVLGISADGDWRLLKSMKTRSNFQNDFFRVETYDALSLEEPCYIQDPTHIGTKLRNRMLKASILLAFGNKIISTSHLKLLLKTVSKDQHGLTYKDIAPDDRQNFASLEKVMKSEVLNSLQKHVVDSEATAAYLNICKYVTSSSLDRKLQPTERVYRIWYAVFLLRTWRNWISFSENYKLDENFITVNAYDCIEINALGIIGLIVKLRNIKKPEWFLPHLFDSQPCERTFRQMRSMGTQNYTKINFTLMELLNMVERVELQNEILHNHLVKTEIKFPRLNLVAKHETVSALPSNQELVITLKRALEDAKKYAMEFGMCSQEGSEKNDATKCAVHVPHSERSKKNDDLDDVLYENCFEDESSIFNNTNSINMPEYDRNKVSVDEESKFIEVFFDDGSSQILKKSSIVWLLTESTNKLSNDRLKRVQTTPKETLHKGRKQNHESRDANPAKIPREIVHRCDDINIGDWCIFKFDFNQLLSSLIYPKKNYGLQNIIIGVILGFRYSNGKTAKEKQYHKDTVSIRRQKEQDKEEDNKIYNEIGALSNWYTIRKEGTLNSLKLGKNSFFVDLKHYLATIEMSTANCAKKEILLPISIEQLSNIIRSIESSIE